MTDNSPDRSRARLIQTEALIVAYAMSRLDDAYRQHVGARTWREAFNHAAAALGVKPASLKNLRDEFDPVHDNARQGWHGRPLRLSRQRVIGELCEVSDAALLEIVDGLLAHDAEVERLITRPLARKRGPEQAAERLRTGRAAERYFLETCQAIVGVPRDEVIDRRDDAAGYDFALRPRPAVAVEVKGLQGDSGQLLFTDHDHRQAQRRRRDYLLVVVGRVHEARRATGGLPTSALDVCANGGHWQASCQWHPARLLLVVVGRVHEQPRWRLIEDPLVSLAMQVSISRRPVVQWAAAFWF